jgi:hypothetical protein
LIDWCLMPTKAIFLLWSTEILIFFNIIKTKHLHLLLRDYLILLPQKKKILIFQYYWVFLSKEILIFRQTTSICQITLNNESYVITEKREWLCTYNWHH